MTYAEIIKSVAWYANRMPRAESINTLNEWQSVMMSCICEDMSNLAQAAGHQISFRRAVVAFKLLLERGWSVDAATQAIVDDCEYAVKSNGKRSYEDYCCYLAHSAGCYSSIDTPVELRELFGSKACVHEAAEAIKLHVDELSRREESRHEGNHPV